MWLNKHTNILTLTLPSLTPLNPNQNLALNPKASRATASCQLQLGTFPVGKVGKVGKVADWA
jgi:hypothetical protein